MRSERLAPVIVVSLVMAAFCAYWSYSLYKVLPYALRDPTVDSVSRTLICFGAVVIGLAALVPFVRLTFTRADKRCLHPWELRVMIWGAWSGGAIAGLAILVLIILLLIGATAN